MKIVKKRYYPVEITEKAESVSKDVVKSMRETGGLHPHDTFFYWETEITEHQDTTIIPIPNSIKNKLHKFRMLYVDLLHYESDERFRGVVIVDNSSYVVSDYDNRNVFITIELDNIEIETATDTGETWEINVVPII